MSHSPSQLALQVALHCSGLAEPAQRASHEPTHSPKQLWMQMTLTPREQSPLHFSVQGSVQLASAFSVQSLRHTVCSLVAQAVLYTPSSLQPAVHLMLPRISQPALTSSRRRLPHS